MVKKKRVFVQVRLIAYEEKSKNSVSVLCTGLTRACMCACTFICLLACEIATSTQSSAKDNTKFLLDRGASHESGVIPATQHQQSAKANKPKKWSRTPAQASLCVEVITEVLRLSLFLILFKTLSFEPSNSNAVFCNRVCPFKPFGLNSSMLTTNYSSEMMRVSCVVIYWFSLSLFTSFMMELLQLSSFYFCKTKSNCHFKSILQSTPKHTAAVTELSHQDYSPIKSAAS